MEKMKDFNCVAFIFARGGSKGILRKNLALLNGKPLLAYSIETALSCPSINRVIVSTDDQEIAKTAEQYGAEVPFMRPKELALDQSSEWDAWQHAIRTIQQKDKELIDIFVSLPPTSPLRSVEDVEKCIKKFIETNADIVITIKQSERNPYFNMVETDAEGFYKVICSSKKHFYQRQSAPQVYDMTTVTYVSNPEFILNTRGVFDGKVEAVLIPTERAIDIDNVFDLKMANILIKEKT